MYHSFSNDGFATNGIRANYYWPEGSSFTNLEDVQKRLKEVFHVESQKNKAMDRKFQEQISGIGVKMQNQFSDINTKLDHIIRIGAENYQKKNRFRESPT